MTELLIEVEDISILSSLRKVLNSLEGVKVKRVLRHKKTGLELALDDVKEGRVYSAKDGEDLIKQCLES